MKKTGNESKTVLARNFPAWCAAGLLVASLSSPTLLRGQSSKDGGQKATAVVTVMAKHGKPSPPVPREAVTIGGNGSGVAGWTPLTGSRAGLQLFILLDDSSSGRINNQLSDVKKFILGLPATTEVAVGYMQNGHAAMTQNFTADHVQAAKKVRSTMGIIGGNGSPYFTLQEVIKHWPAEAVPGSSNAAQSGTIRREILMVTDGVDLYEGPRFDPENQYVLTAIQDAQHAGVLVHSIYFRGAGGPGRNSEVTLGGQSYLQMVAKATGGECYTEGFGNPVSFQPFLDELSERLQNQYELGFVTGGRADHGLVPLKLKVQLPGVSVDAPAMARVNLHAASDGMK